MNVRVNYLDGTSSGDDDYIRVYDWYYKSYIGGGQTTADLTNKSKPLARTNYLRSGRKGINDLGLDGTPSNNYFYMYNVTVETDNASASAVDNKKAVKSITIYNSGSTDQVLNVFAITGEKTTAAAATPTNLVSRILPHNTDSESQRTELQLTWDKVTKNANGDDISGTVSYKCDIATDAAFNNVIVANKTITSPETTADDRLTHTYKFTDDDVEKEASQTNFGAPVYYTKIYAVSDDGASVPAAYNFMYIDDETACPTNYTSYTLDNATYAHDMPMILNDAGEGTKRESWGTMCLPFPIKKESLGMDYITLYNITSIEDRVIKLSEIAEVIPACTPIIYYNSDDDSSRDTDITESAQGDKSLIDGYWFAIDGDKEGGTQITIPYKAAGKHIGAVINETENGNANGNKWTFLGNTGNEVDYKISKEDGEYYYSLNADVFKRSSVHVPRYRGTWMVEASSTPTQTASLAIDTDVTPTAINKIEGNDLGEVFDGTAEVYSLDGQKQSSIMPGQVNIIKTQSGKTFKVVFGK